MKIIITATDQITQLDGVPVRVWDGVTEDGVACQVFVHRLRVAATEDTSRFDQELQHRLGPGRVVELRDVR
jgi:hypothetical protein